MFHRELDGDTELHPAYVRSETAPTETRPGLVWRIPSTGRIVERNAADTDWLVVIGATRTAAAWTSANPTLAAGEWGVETDTRKMKLGDGSTAWTSLTYVAAPLSTFFLTLLDDANAGAVLTTLGVTAAAQTILDDASVAAIRATLLVEPEAVQTVYVTPAQALTSTTVVAVTGLTLTLATGTYDIRAWLEYSSADDTVGLKVGMTCTNLTLAVLHGLLWWETDNFVEGTLRASGDTFESAGAINADDHFLVRIEGRLVVSGSATFQITGGRQTDVGGFTVTAHAGRIVASKLA
jgi:hypothetical protein